MSGWGGDDRGPTLNAVFWTLTGLSIVTVALRVLSRTCFGANKLGLDDYFTLVCIGFMLASGIAISLAVDAGVGKHITDLTPSDLMEAKRRTAVVNFFVVWTFSMPKFAIIALLRRLLRLSKPVQYIFWAVAIVNQLGISTTSILWFARCRPAVKAWDPSVVGVCDTPEVLENLGYVNASISAALDMFFALYPVPYIMKLNMSLRRRVLISVSLGLGSVACVVSVYKITTFPATFAELAIDPTYGVVPMVLFATVEANILILAASLSTLAPIVRWVVGKSSSTTLDKNTGKSGGHRSGTWHNRNIYKLNDTENQAPTFARHEFLPLFEVGENRSWEIHGLHPDKPDGSGIRKQIRISVSYE